LDVLQSAAHISSSHEVSTTEDPFVTPLVGGNPSIHS
jgi:hypothetical protein